MQNAFVSIRQLRLHLPAGFESRAGNIGRLLKKELGRVQVPRDVTIGRLKIECPPIGDNASDRQLAIKIAGAISSAIHNAL